MINCWQRKDEFVCLYFYLKNQNNINIDPLLSIDNKKTSLTVCISIRSIKSIIILINFLIKRDESLLFVGAWGEPAEYAEVPGHDTAVQPPPGGGAEGQVRLIKMKNSNGRQRLYLTNFYYSTCFKNIWIFSFNKQPVPRPLTHSFYKLTRYVSFCLYIILQKNS